MAKMSTSPGFSPGGDQNKAPMLRAILSSELAVTTIVIIGRLFTRLKLIHSPGVDDWIMLFTYVGSFFTSVFLIGCLILYTNTTRLIYAWTPFFSGLTGGSIFEIHLVRNLITIIDDNCLIVTDIR